MSAKFIKAAVIAMASTFALTAALAMPRTKSRVHWINCLNS